MLLKLQENMDKNLTLLYCVSNYPSKIKNFNLNNIRLLKKRFKCKVGLSDHSKDNIVAISAVAAGAYGRKTYCIKKPKKD